SPEVHRLRSLLRTAGSGQGSALGSSTDANAAQREGSCMVTHLEPSPARTHRQQRHEGFPQSRPAAQTAALSRHCERSTDMNTITTHDGTEIYYKDWGEGPVVTFSHGWPLSSDAWDGQM